MSCALAVAASDNLRADLVTYQVVVDTTPIAGAAGFVDFDFAPGNGSQAAFLSISSSTLSSHGSTSLQVSGGVSRSLPGAITIDNSTQFNDYFLSLTYGTAIDFFLTLDGRRLHQQRRANPAYGLSRRRGGGIGLFRDGPPLGADLPERAVQSGFEAG
jgi:hypothetical protein